MQKGTYFYDPYAHPHFTRVGVLPTIAGFSGLGAVRQMAPPSVNTSDPDAVARYNYAETVRQAVKFWTEKIDQILAGDLSIGKTFSRNPLFWETTYEARLTMENAKKQLNEQFLPIALSAINDKSRFLSEVKESVENYLQQLNGQFQTSFKIATEQTLKKAAGNLKPDPTKWEWWQWGLVAMGAAYIYNAVRPR